ncbi:MAG: GNAT family N-acetyltransferase [Acidobacteriota bacterium]
MTDLCCILEWDSNFFGRRISRIETDRLTSQSLDEILRWSQEQGIDCLYFLCSPDNDGSVALAESAGFHLVDIRIELNWKPQEIAKPQTTVIREFQETDLAELQQIASQVYTNTRFSFDKHFPPNQVAELYSEWLTVSCRNESHKVFVAGDENCIAGFITCQMENSTTGSTGKNLTIGRIGLLALKVEAQGKGYGQQLVQAALNYFHATGATEVQVVTQGRNIAAQRLYQACGFRTYKVGLWYHKWL